MKARRAYLPFLALVAILDGCAKAPPGTDPLASAKLHVQQAQVAVATLETAASVAHQAHAISDADWARIQDVSARAQHACTDAITALEAGEDQTTTKARVVAVVRQALEDLPSNLSPAAAEQIAPALRLVRLALDILSPPR